MFKNIKKLVAMGVVASMLVANVGVVGFAATVQPGASTATVNVLPGNLSMTDLGATSFEDAHLSGVTQTITSGMPTTVTLTDATGSGAGWNVSMQATPFTNAAATGTIKTLSPGSLTLGDITVTPKDDSKPIVASAASGAIDNETGVTILTAGTDEGMGTYDISMTAMSLKLLVSETKAGTYTSTITTTLTAGPAA